MPARIFVPTKGRDRRRKWLWDRVPEAELVIEPQDCDRYEGLHYHVLPENDRGIGFARNWVWQLTDEPFWLIDDDVCGIAEWTDRLQTIPIVEGLDRMEEYANSIDPGAFTFGPVSRLACRKKDTYQVNRQVHQIHYIRPHLCDPIDRDLTYCEIGEWLLRHWTQGCCSLTLRKFAHSVSRETGADCDGGCTGWRATSFDCANSIAHRYHGLVESTIGRNGYGRLKFNWKEIDLATQ
jgi:hypothetical protein